MLVSYANRAKSQLANTISVGSGNISVISGQGNLFPAITSGNQFYPITLVSASDQSQFEICYVTSRNADTMTVLRGQEGTTPMAFVSGDIVTLNMTAKIFSLFSQAGYLGGYSNDIAVAIGGYKKNAVLADDNLPATLWISLQNNNLIPPDNNARDWWRKINLLELNEALGTYVSGNLGKRPQDRQGVSLYTDNDTNLPYFKDASGVGFLLAPQYSVDTVNVDLQNFKSNAITSYPYSGYDSKINRIRAIHSPNPRASFELEDSQYNFECANYQDVVGVQNDLNNFKQDAVTGHGFGPGDARILNIWMNNNSRPRIQAKIDGRSDITCARIEDINDERSYAQSILNQLNTLQNHAIISDAYSGQDTAISTMRIVHDKPYPRLYVQGRGTGQYDLKVPNYEETIKEKQYFTVEGKHGDWVPFPKKFNTFERRGNDTNIAVFMSVVGYWGDDGGKDSDNSHVIIPMVTTKENQYGGTTDMDATGFRLNLYQVWRVKDAHIGHQNQLVHVKVWAIALP